jgi:hypothetical protein
MATPRGATTPKLEPDSCPAEPEPEAVPRSAAARPVADVELVKTEVTNADDAHHVPIKRRPATGRRRTIAKEF